MKDWKKYIFSHIWGLLIIAQLVLVFGFEMVHESRIDALVYTGYVIWVISAVLGWLPMLTLKKRGGVAKGKSYVRTTILVDTGIFSVIRHPQYTAGFILNLAMALVSQHWIIVVLGIAGMIIMYRDIILADRHEIEKFGEDYRRYMKKVPRMNLILGLIRLISRRKA